eukprot:4878273-Prymnesium_polylepis.1
MGDGGGRKGVGEHAERTRRADTASEHGLPGLAAHLWAAVTRPEGADAARLQLLLPVEELFHVIGDRVHQKVAAGLGAQVEGLARPDVGEVEAVGGDGVAFEQLHLKLLPVDGAESVDQVLRLVADESTELVPAVVGVEDGHRHERVGVGGMKEAQAADLGGLAPCGQHPPHAAQVLQEGAVLVPHLRGGGIAERRELRGGRGERA